MLKLVKRLGLCLLATLPMMPDRAEALGSGFIDAGFLLTGNSCTFNIYHDGTGQESQVQLFVPGQAGASPSSGGNYWVGGTIQSWPANITAANITTACGITNIQNFVSNGANGTYATDAFMGVTFRGTTGSQTFDYVIGLSGASTTTVVNSRVEVFNTPPTANAGPDQTVDSADLVGLNGTASSDPDAGTTLTYAWTQSSGPVVTLSSTTAASPTFTAPIVAANGSATLVFSLIVSDGTASSTADTVTITVDGPPNTAPTADAGPDQTVDAGDAVSLAGAGSSDPDAGQTLTYAWVQIAGTTVTLTGANTASAGFTAPDVAPETSIALTFQLTVGDGIAVDTDTVTITVDGPSNTAPTADAGPDDTVGSGQGYTLDGSGSSDSDFGQTLTYAWTQTSGTPVTLTGATTVGPGFTAPTLAFGDADETLEFSLVVNDGIDDSLADTVTITVTAPPNTPPTSNAGPDQSVDSGVTVTLDGTGSSDPDASQTLQYFWFQSDGPLVAVNGAFSTQPTFSAPTLTFPQAPVVLRFQLSVFDGTDTAFDTVEITVNSVNQPPVADAGPDQTAAAGASVLLDGSGSSDPDPDLPLGYAWTQTAGTAVTLTGATTDAPGFTAPAMLPGEADLTLTFSLVVDDGYLDSPADTVTITVEAPANVDPTADAGPDQTVDSGDAVTLDGSGSDANNAGQTLTYTWVQTAGTATTLGGATSANPSFTAPTVAVGDADLVLTFELTVDDGISTDTDTVTVTVMAPPNMPPIANAGPDQTVASAASVTLDGTGSSDTDVGQVLTYTWEQTSGPAVTLSGASTATPGFTAPTLAIGQPSAVLVFQLEVNDGIDVSARDSVRITVDAPPNTPPTANAGPNQAVLSAASVTLNGTGSSANDAGQTLTYSWGQTAGPAVSFNGALASPSFTAPTLATGAPGVVLTFALQVDDGFDVSTADTVNVTVLPAANTAPVANAGPDQSVLGGGGVTLDGSASSDPDAASVLYYNWVQTSGPAVTLTGATGTAPSFTAPSADIGDSFTMTFELTVSDTLASVTDTVTITVNGPPNTPPTANAGADFTVASGAAGSLDGTGSNPNDAGQTLVYSWVQTSGPTFTLSDVNAASPTFTAPYIPPALTNTLATFNLFVFDGFVLSAADSVTVTITPPANTAATANAGPDQTVASGASVTLDGTGSAANDAGQTLTYSWAQTAGTSVTLDDPNAATPIFTAPTLNVGDADITLTFELIVYDGVANSAADTVSITVTAPTNTTPTANAGADQTVANGASVTLDGSGSSDPESDPLTYAWTQTAGATVTVTGATTAAPSFTAPTLVLGDTDAVLNFELIVNDGFVSSAADTVSITVTAPGSGQAPSVTVAGPGTYTDGVDFDVTITFSEPVTGFVAGDLQVTNATVSGMTGSGANYVATLSPTAYPAVITVGVPAAVAVDVEALDNTASGTASIAASSAEEASEAIEEALIQRARALINAQPKLRRFLLPGGSNSFVASVTQNRSTFGLSVGQDSPVWLSLQGEWSKTGEDEQDYVNFAFGGHLWRSENVIIGAMVQFDDAKTSSPTERFRGEGWLVGPYIVARAANQPLVFSASILTGETRNELTLEGLGTDRFDSKRTIFTAGVEGQFVTANGLVLIPSFDIAHVRDAQEAYVDSASNPVPEQTITLTEASFGLGFEKGLLTKTGDMVLTGKISGIFAKEEGGTTDEESFRGRIDLGADLAFSDTSSLRLGAYYDGLGADDYEAWGADLMFQLKF